MAPSGARTLTAAVLGRHGTGRARLRGTRRPSGSRWHLPLRQCAARTATCEQAVGRNELGGGSRGSATPSPGSLSRRRHIVGYSSPLGRADEHSGSRRQIPFELLKTQCEVLAENDSTLAVYKPEGLSFHKEGDEPGLFQALRELQREGRMSYQGDLFSVHRLDKVTSGNDLFLSSAASKAGTSGPRPALIRCGPRSEDPELCKASKPAV
eukprot:scaffold5337_cov411-Prasinococcus_capsulatus_cf.AAC.10